MTVVVSLLAPDGSSALAWPRATWRGADAVELRLDAWPAVEVPRIAECVERWNKPVVAALHGSEGLGSLRGSLEEHLELLQAARTAGAAWIDVDARWAAAHAERDQGARIVSQHVLDPGADWRAAYAALTAAARPKDRIKFVVAVEDAESGLEVMAWVRDQPPWPGGRTAFCMGERARFTRLLAWAQADAWVYCAPDGLEAVPSAPGQFSLSQWRERAPEPAGTLRAWQGVVGAPVEHSLSPWMHTRALRAAGSQAAYLALHPSDWETFVRALRPWAFEGLAITAPFKGHALRDSATQDQQALRLGAANTWKATPQGWHASNTDPAGVGAALDGAWKEHRNSRGLPKGFADARALVLGGGGAARAALEALRERGMELHLATRDEVRGRALAEAWSAVWHSIEAVGEQGWDLVVHTTPLGHGGRGLLLSPAGLRSETLYLDAVYAPRWTPLLASARAVGATTVTGDAWLLGQAHAQFRAITGQDPDDASLRAGLLDHLQESARPGEGPVVLIGLRAAGKSTLGPRLAQALGGSCLDLDDAIGARLAAEAGLDPAPSAGAALRAWGLEAFRAVEEELALQALAGPEQRVVVLGAGAVESPKLRTALASRGRVVWVDASLQTRTARQAADKADRPGLVAGADVAAEQAALAVRRGAWYRELAQWGYSTEADVPPAAFDALVAWCRDPSGGSA